MKNEVKSKNISLLIRLHEKSEFLDRRELKGCTQDELYKISQLIGLEKKIPLVLKEYLLYCGKWYCNVGRFYHSIINANNYEINKKLLSEKEYLILEYSEESSVQCGYKYEELSLEDPPYYTCETENKSDFYQIQNSLCSNERLDEVAKRLNKYDKYYRDNQDAYSLKQNLIELYSYLEINIQKENRPQNIINSLRRLAQETYYMRRTNMEFNYLRYEARILNKIKELQLTFSEIDSLKGKITSVLDEISITMKNKKNKHEG